MICESCKFENREGALFCAECGKPLASANENAEKPMEKEVNKTVILDEVVTNSKESVDKEDDSEANTTVLTSDMLKPAQAAAPVSPQPMAPQAPKMVAPQGAPMGQPMAPQGAPMGQPQAPKMAAPQGAPMGQPMAPQGTPANGQPAPMAPQGAPMNAAPATPTAPAAPTAPAPAPAEKPAKEGKKADKKSDKKADKKAAKEEKKAKKGKMGVGTKVYIAISIILMLAMAGAIVYGYYHYTGKLEDAKAEKETLITDYDAQLSQKDNEIANLYASSTDAQSTIASLESQLASSQTDLATAQATADSYVAYDPLISFVESSTADSSTDMMVSDTVVYTTVGSTVQVYVYFPSQEGQLSYVVSNVEIVDCTWGEEWVNGNVLPISIEAKSAGDVTVEVTNDQNDITEKIFVHVE